MQIYIIVFRCYFIIVIIRKIPQKHIKTFEQYPKNSKIKVSLFSNFLPISHFPNVTTKYNCSFPKFPVSIHISVPIYLYTHMCLWIKCYTYM